MASDDLHNLKNHHVRRVTLIGLAGNLLLAAIKFILGIISKSQALIADAVHSLSDSVTDVAVIVGAQFWSAPADEDHPHGHGRIETVITLFIGVILALVGIGITWNALTSINADDRLTPSWWALTAAFLSIIGKELLYRYTITAGKRLRSSALMANAWHHRSDALSSIPVAIAVLGAHIIPEWTFLDPIAAVLVSALILHAAWSITWPALLQLTDQGASADERKRLAQRVRQIQGVHSLHKLRTRQVGPDLQVDLHIQVDPYLTVRQGHDIAGHVKQHLIDTEPDIVDVLVHIEPYEG